MITLEQLNKAITAESCDWFQAQLNSGELPNLSTRIGSEFVHNLAVRRGRLDLLQWMATKYNIEVLARKCGKEPQTYDPIDFSRPDSWSACVAAEHNQLEILKWLVFDCGNPVNAAQSGSLALQMAAKCGHLDIVQWLVLEYSETIRQMKERNPSLAQDSVEVSATGFLALKLAAAGGHLSTATWLVENCHPTLDLRPKGQHRRLYDDFLTGFLIYKAFIPYLKEVAEMQEALGIDEWCRVVQETRQVPKRVLSRM